MIQLPRILAAAAAITLSACATPQQAYVPPPPPVIQVPTLVPGIHYSAGRHEIRAYYERYGD
jgi:hypothetical protein